MKSRKYGSVPSWLAKFCLNPPSILIHAAWLAAVALISLAVAYMWG